MGKISKTTLIKCIWSESYIMTVQRLIKPKSYYNIITLLSLLHLMCKKLQYKTSDY